MATTEPATTTGSIDALLQEDRRYPPSQEFKAQANWNDPSIYQRAEADPEAFWAEQAKAIDWFKPWDKVLEWDVPWAKWFVGAEVNASYNCVDRHLKGWRRNKAAIVLEGEPGDARVLTYRDLYREVNRAAAALKRLGVKKGDRVAIYLGMIPELPIAMLACARIGATHTVIFAGFSADSIADRVNDCEAVLAITADGGWRRGNKIPLKDTMDKAVESCTTSKPKVMLHTTGGYLVGTASTHKYIFDLKEEDVFWCTADVGWVTGHSYIVYGPLANG